MTSEPSEGEETEQVEEETEQAVEPEEEEFSFDRPDPGLLRGTTTLGLRRILEPASSEESLTTDSGYGSTERIPSESKQEAEAKKAENDYRANEKYRHTSQQILEGFERTIKDSELNATYNTIMQYGSPPTKKDQTCAYYTKKALESLKQTGSFRNEREAYKAYKKNLRMALATPEYKNHPNSPIAQLLNALSYAEFTQVNVSGFTESVAQKMAEQEGFQPTKAPSTEGWPKEIQQQGHLSFFASQLHNLRPFHAAIRNKAQLLPKIRGAVTFLDFDPSLRGNPANVKFQVFNRTGQLITNIRTPTPTDNTGKVSPEFKAFLRHLRANDQKYAMINLQNREKPSRAKQSAGLAGEYIRSRNLENLAKDPEFRDTLTVFTLDKNSPFFQQLPSKMDLNQAIDRLKTTALPDRVKTWKKMLSQRKEHLALARELSSYAESHNCLNALPKSFQQAAPDFMKTFMEQLTSNHSGFHLPESWKSEEKTKQLQSILEMVHETAFNKKDSLTPAERQDFIEIAYIFLADFYVKETGATFYNESCKDCIDRGGGANWAMFTFLTMLEIFRDEPRDVSAALDRRIATLPAKFEEDAIFAKKRPAIFERVERAEGAFLQLLKAAKKRPEVIQEWTKQLHFRELKLESNSAQATKDPDLSTPSKKPRLQPPSLLVFPTDKKVTSLEEYAETYNTLVGRSIAVPLETDDEIEKTKKTDIEAIDLIAKDLNRNQTTVINGKDYLKDLTGITDQHERIAKSEELANKIANDLNQLFNGDTAQVSRALKVLGQNAAGATTEVIKQKFMPDSGEPPILFSNEQPLSIFLHAQDEASLERPESAHAWTVEVVSTFDLNSIDEGGEQFNIGQIRAYHTIDGPSGKGFVRLEIIEPLKNLPIKVGKEPTLSSSRAGRQKPKPVTSQESPTVLERVRGFVQNLFTRSSSQPAPAPQQRDEPMSSAQPPVEGRAGLVEGLRHAGQRISQAAHGLFQRVKNSHLFAQKNREPAPLQPSAVFQVILPPLPEQQELVLSACQAYFSQPDVYETEGIFRKQGGAKKVAELTSSMLQAHTPTLADELKEASPVDVANALKRFMKECHPFEQQVEDELLAVDLEDQENAIKELRIIVDESPNTSALRLMFSIFRTTAEHSEENKMKSSNLAISTIGSFTNDVSNLNKSSKLTACIAFMIDHYDQIFQSD